ncbi:MAG: RusA family crossover junction endodeoxyribonuclease [Scytonema hyalinum WJT4-NPBG1]|nr:RusA family crossover junction endodeoxyribonuclease [Scytonema hyalinum WJT4-NPBG1]
MIEIWLEGRGVGKARPRFGRGGVIHTASRYGEWKNSAVLQLVAMKLSPAPIPAKVDCTFVNFFSSDADNLSGSVLDSLVEAGVLQNDSSSYVVSCSGSFARTRKRRGQDKPVGILVRISEAEIEYLDFDITNIAPHSVA